MNAYPAQLLDLIAVLLPGESRSPFTIAETKGQAFAQATARAFLRRSQPVTDALLEGWAELLSVDAEVVRRVLARDTSLAFSRGRRRKKPMGKTIEASVERSELASSLQTSHVEPT